VVDKQAEIYVTQLLLTWR